MPNSDSTFSSDEAELRERDVEQTASPSAAPKPWGSFIDPRSHIDSVRIMGYEKVSKTVGSYIAYQIGSTIDVKGEKESYEVLRRYNDFLYLHNYLKSIPGIFLPQFPSKDFYNKFNEVIIEQRKAVFSEYLSSVLKRHTQENVKYILYKFVTLERSEFSFYKKKVKLSRIELHRKQMGGVLEKLMAKHPRVDLALLERMLEIKIDESAEAMKQEEFEACADAAAVYFRGFGELSDVTDDSVNSLLEISADYNNLKAKIEEIATDGGQDKVLFQKGEKKQPEEGAQGAAKEREPVSGRIGKMLMKLADVFGTMQTGFKGISEADSELQRGLAGYSNDFREVTRLAKQHGQYERNILDSKRMIAEYSRKKIKERDFGRKRKIDSTVEMLEQYIKLQEKAKLVFAFNFKRGYENFKANRSEKIKRITEEYFNLLSQPVHETMAGLERICED